VRALMEQRRQILGGVGLGSVFLVSIGWIVLGWPLPFQLWFVLALIAGGSITLFVRFVRPKHPTQPWKLPITAGITCTTLLAALAAVPADQGDRESAAGGSVPADGSSPTTISTPKSVPVLDVTVGPGAGTAFAYALPVPPESLAGIPKANGECETDERHMWVIGKGGVPLDHQDLYVYFQTRRDDAVVVLSQVKVTARRIRDHYDTVVAPCPENINSGGRPEGRIVEIELGNSPQVMMTDEENKELPSLSLQLTKGESAEVILTALTDRPGVGYEWSAEVTYVFEGQARQIRIPAEGWYRVGSTTDNPQCWSDIATPNIVRHEDSNTDWC
jgi:hypothetical protein